MKAACVLLCLTLGASASSRHSQNEDFNQYQLPLYQPEQSSKHNTHGHQFESQDRSSETQEIQDVYQQISSRLDIVPSVLHTIPRYQRLQNDKSNRQWNWPMQSQQSVWREQMPVYNNQAIQNIFSEAKESMKPWTEEEKTRFQETLAIATLDEEVGHLNATEMIKKNQYPVEEHTVKTDDGYVLTLFRIQASNQMIENTKPVVFLMHGLLGSADDWLLMGPKHSLAYLLADAGYDVWLGNARGNRYSRRHVTKHPALNDFWKFSTDEIALHDLPAMIDYTLKISGQDKLHYVGHASGATVFFALVASRPAYNEKIICMHALSPMVYMSHTRSPLFRMVAPNSSFSSRMQRLIGRGAFEPTKEVIATIGGDMLANEIGINKVASNVNFVMSGMIDSAENVPVVVSHLPAGGSARTIKQFGQAVAYGFRKYDFGPFINSQMYGNVVPPKYNLSRVTVPVTLYSSSEDWLAQPADVSRLHSELPRSEHYEVPEPHFSHMDFQFSSKAPELVYKKVIAALNHRY